MPDKRQITEVRHKELARGLINRIGEYKADYSDILQQLEDIRRVCLEGINTQKVCVSSETGVVDVLEILPAVAVQAAMGKLAVLKELAKLADQYDVDPEIIVNIQLGNLEDTL
jgi:hypothetical protein